MKDAVHFRWSDPKVQQLAIRHMIDTWRARNERELGFIKQATIGHMRNELGQAAVENAALFESRRMDLPGCPTQLDLVLYMVPKQDTYRFESRVRGRISTHWVVRTLAWLGDRFLSWSAYWDRRL